MSGALECPKEERRMIVSIDTTEMVKHFKNNPTTEANPSTNSHCIMCTSHYLFSIAFQTSFCSELLILIHPLFVCLFDNIFFVLLQNKVLWIDEQNLTMRAQAGIIGEDLERKVQ